MVMVTTAAVVAATTATPIGANHIAQRTACIKYHRRPGNRAAFFVPAPVLLALSSTPG